MAVKDLHDKPFDQGTLTKLEIFERYTQAWIPVFAMESLVNLFQTPVSNVSINLGCSDALMT